MSTCHRDQSGSITTSAATRVSADNGAKVQVTIIQSCEMCKNLCTEMLKEKVDGKEKPDRARRRWIHDVKDRAKAKAKASDSCIHNEP